MSSGPVSCSTSAPSHAASNPLSSDNEEEWLAHFRAELQRNQESRLAELLQKAEAEFQRASGLLAARHAHVNTSDSLSDDAFDAAKAKLLRAFDAQKRRIRQILEEEKEELIEYERGIRKLSLDGKVEDAETQTLIREQEELFGMFQAQVQYSESANVSKTGKSPLPSVPSRRTTRDPPPRPISSQRSNASTLPSGDQIRSWHDFISAARRNTESRDTLSPNRYQDRQQSSSPTRMPGSLPQNTASVMQHSRSQNQSRSSSQNRHRIWLPSAPTDKLHRPSTGMLQKQPQIIPEPTPVLKTTAPVSTRGTSDSPHSLLPKQDSYMPTPSPPISTPPISISSRRPSPFANDLRPPSPRSLPGSMAMPGGNLSRYQSKVLEPVAHAQTTQDTRANKFLPHTRAKSYAMEDSLDFEPSSASPGAGFFNENVRSSPSTSVLSDRMAKERDRDTDRKQKESEEAINRQTEELRQQDAQQRKREAELSARIRTHDSGTHDSGATEQQKLLFEEQQRRLREELLEEQLAAQERTARKLREELVATQRAREAEFAEQQRVLEAQRQREAELRQQKERELAVKEEELSRHRREMEEWLRLREEGEIAEQTRQLELQKKKEAALEEQQRVLEAQRQTELEAQRRKEDELRQKVEELKRRQRELRRQEEERAAEQRRKEDELRAQEDELKRQEWAFHQREEALARRQKEEELRAKEEALERHRRELQQREEEHARREEEDERRRNEERTKKDREVALRRQREEEDRKRVEGHVLKKLEKEREREQEEREARERQTREREERERERREKDALSEREELKQQEELTRFYEQRKLQEDARRRDPRGTASSSSFSHSIPNPSASFSSASGSFPSGRASASSIHSNRSVIRRLPLSSASSAALKLSRASTASPAISAWLPSTRPTFASASSSSSNLTEPGESHKATAGSWKTPGSAGIGADPSPTSGGGSGSNMNSSPLSEVEWRRLQEENARKQQEQFWRDCLQAEQEREAQAAAATTASAGGHEQLLRVWAAYESAWASLKDRPILFFRSIPWPILRQPSDAEDLTADAIGAFVLSPAHSSDKSTPDRLKEQLLRWDPDCFESKWLLKVNMEEKELVRRSVEQVVCGLNKLQDPIEVLKRLLLKLKDLDLTDKLHGEPTWKAGGGYADVLLGQLSNGKPVAIKRLRTHLLQTDPVKLTKTVSRELRVWSKAPQKNILPLKGYLLEIIDGLPYPIPSFVTDWMEAGSLTQYLHSGREVRSLFLIEGIANGLEHLHNSKIIHGDLKSQNVLISMDGDPLLTDFGLSHLITSTSTCETATDAIKGSSRWQSPELINPKDDVSYSEVIHTEKSDIWAFGMTGLEVLTKKLPYAHLKTDGQIFLAIHQGHLPIEPTDLQGRKVVEKNLWKLCTGCWVKDPLERPSAAQLLRALEQLRNSST